jgi:tetratricopeptide (TPR) repeat protein
MTEKRYCNKQYLLSLVLFILALSSKPATVTLPAVFLILDWYPFRRIRSLKSFRDACFEKLPFIGLSLIVSVVTFLGEKAHGTMEPLVESSVAMRVLVAFKALMMYLWKMIAPINLIPFYPYPENISFLSFEYLSALTLVCGITTTCILMLKKLKIILAIWLYYLITLFPVLGIIKVRDLSMADRYTYLPSQGLFLLLGLAAAWVWAKTDSLKQWSPTVKGFTTAVAISLVISLSYATLKQIAVWRDSLTLFADAVRKLPDGALSHNNLGNAYLQQNRVGEAVNELATALKLKPNYGDAHYNLGVAYLQQNRLDEAANEFIAVLKLDPDYVDAHYNLGTAYLNQKRLDEAVNEFIIALKLKPDNAEAHNNIGAVYLHQNRVDEATNEFIIALKLKPDNAEARYNLGAAYLHQNRFDEAANEFIAVLKLKPDDAEARHNLEICYERMKPLKR